MMSSEAFRFYLEAKYYVFRLMNEFESIILENGKIEDFGIKTKI